MLKAMSCCWSKKLFGRRSKREDAYKVKEVEEEVKEGEKTATDEPEAPKFSWEKREKVDPSTFIIKDLSDQVHKKDGQDGGPMQIENCTDSTLLFLQHTSQVIIDDCRHCLIVIGPTEGSVFIRDCSNCTVLTACNQLRTRDCTSVRIGILCPTEPIIENSSDMMFHNLAMFYPGMREQLHAAGLSEFINRVTTVHDFTPAGTDGKRNFKVHMKPVPISEDGQANLVANGVTISKCVEEFIPRFCEAKDRKLSNYIVLSNKEQSSTSDKKSVADRALELLRQLNAADVGVLATYDLLTKDVDSKMVAFAGEADRLILFKVYTENLAKFEAPDATFNVVPASDEESCERLIAHLEGKKSG